jgi:hypothetical protein
VLVVGTLMLTVAGMRPVSSPFGVRLARLEMLSRGSRVSLLGMLGILWLGRSGLGRGMMVPIMVALRVVHQ